MREFGRSLRVADFVRDELAQIMQRHMRDPRVGLLSVNDVTVSKDLSYAEIYVSSVDTSSAEERDELISVLNKAAGFFRSELAKRHSMRTTPKPRFHYDELVEKGPALEALIESAISEDASRRVESGRDDEQDDRV
ncbi:MAG: 30S ribosome-binding factor RbfA [Pseudomonadales bacterium]